MRLTILGLGVLTTALAAITPAEAAHVEIRADGSRILIIVEGKTVAIVPGSLLLADGITPVPPGPGPDPKPPVPPDKLAAELKQLYDADGGATKVNDLKALQQVYKQGTDLADDASFTTVGDLFGVLKDASKGVAKDALGSLRDRLAAELKANLPGGAAAKLDPELRKKIRELLAKIAALLLGLL